MFSNKLNSLHPYLEKKVYEMSPFFNVKIGKNTSTFLTSIYTKPTFIGQYSSRDLLEPSKRKANLISI